MQSLVCIDCLYLRWRIRRNTSGRFDLVNDIPNDGMIQIACEAYASWESLERDDKWHDAIKRLKSWCSASLPT